MEKKYRMQFIDKSRNILKMFRKKITNAKLSKTNKMRDEEYIQDDYENAKPRNNLLINSLIVVQSKHKELHICSSENLIPTQAKKK